MYYTTSGRGAEHIKNAEISKLALGFHLFFMHPNTSDVELLLRVPQRQYLQKSRLWGYSDIMHLCGIEYCSLPSVKVQVAGHRDVIVGRFAKLAGFMQFCGQAGHVVGLGNMCEMMATVNNLFAADCFLQRAIVGPGDASICSQDGQLRGGAWMVKRGMARG